MIQPDDILFRGKPLQDLNLDELRDALVQALNELAQRDNLGGLLPFLRPTDWSVSKWPTPMPPGQHLRYIRLNQTDEKYELTMQLTNHGVTVRFNAGEPAEVVALLLQKLVEKLMGGASNG